MLIESDSASPSGALDLFFTKIVVCDLTDNRDHLPVWGTTVPGWGNISDLFEIRSRNCSILRTLRIESEYLYT